MKIRARLKAIEIGTNLKPELVFATERVAEQVERLVGKVVDIDIEEYKKERTLTANRLLLGSYN